MWFYWMEMILRRGCVSEVGDANIPLAIDAVAGEGTPLRLKKIDTVHGADSKIFGKGVLSEGGTVVNYFFGLLQAESNHANSPLSWSSSPNT